MDINILENLLKQAKELKSDYVYFKGDTIYGTDDNFVYLKRMKVKEPIIAEISFNVNQMALFIKNVGFNEIKVLDNNGSLYSSFDNTLQINNFTTRLAFADMIAHIENWETYCNKLLLDEPIRGLNDFEEIVNKKASEGSDIFRYKNFNMTLYKNLLPIKKSDKVTLNIYDVNIKSFLSKFNIIRSKCIIEVFVMYLHL